MKKLFILILMAACHLGLAQQQDTIQPLRVRKNVIQGSVGFIIFSAGAQLNYERQLIQFKDNSLSGLWANAGIGYWGVMANFGGPFQHLSMGLMSGHENNHFEFTFGISRLYDKAGVNYDRISGKQPVPTTKADDVVYWPLGSLGYRYQKPGGGFVFRCGIAYPPLPYIGIGAAF